MRARIVGFGLFLLTFAFYVLGASPALDGGDSGEFIAASHTLGISHAPGYPLIALLLKAFQIVLPLGSVAYRCHVFSALTACALLSAFHVLLKPFSRRKIVPALAVLFFATRPLVIEQARVVEVFLLNALFAAAILLALRNKNLSLGTFLFGLGLGNHQTLVVVAPFFLWRVWRDRVPWDDVFLAAGAFLLGLSIYIYLPVRAHAGPPVNFGNPETWARFWAVVTRKEFGALSLHPAAVPFRSAALLREQWVALLKRNFFQLRAGGALICALGAVIGFFRRETRAPTLILALAWLGVGFGFEALANLSPFSDIGQWRLERFMLLPLMMLASFAMIAFDGAMNFSRRYVRIAAVLFLAALVAPSTWASLSAPTFRWNMAFRDFAISTLRSAPANTRLVIDRVLFDEPTSSLLVTTQVENKRPDVVFYYRPGTLFQPMYGKNVLSLDWDERFRRQSDVERALLVSSSTVRCLAFEKKNSPFANPELEGMLYRDRFATASPASMTVWRLTNTSDYPTRLISAHTPYFLGKAEMDAGHVEPAEKWFDRALALGYDMAWLQSNIGGIYAQQGLLPQARRQFGRAAAFDPYFYEGPFGLGYVALKENRLADAVASLSQAVRADPDRSTGWYMLGVACYESHDVTSTRRAWKHYLVLDPNGPMAEIVGKSYKSKKPVVILKPAGRHEGSSSVQRQEILRFALDDRFAAKIFWNGIRE